jgi:hypothetical protein
MEEGRTLVVVAVVQKDGAVVVSGELECVLMDRHTQSYLEILALA